MRNSLIAAGAAACLAAALPAVAAPAAGQETAQAGAQAGQSGRQQRARDPDRRVCVNAQMSDSRIRRRICRTQAEWDALQGGDDLDLRR